MSVICNKVSHLQGLYILHSLEGAAEECLGLVLCPLQGQEWWAPSWINLHKGSPGANGGTFLLHVTLDNPGGSCGAR